jgi:toxin-antitoxin system PIN domain toxin
MRTTVTLEPDVHARLEEYARQARTSFRKALNEVVRRGLVAGEVPVVNLPVYAHNSGAPHHAASRAWLEQTLSGVVPVGLPWAISLGFIRLVTHARVVMPPMAPADALGCIRALLACSRVRVLEPGPRHLDILERLLATIGVGGALTTDAHLAALAIEHPCELHSNDADFARFPGLRWHNPLAA